MTKETKTMDIVAYGLTKRELIAAMAMQGALANQNCNALSEKGMRSRKFPRMKI
jgi:hypothetical protein